MQGKIEMVQGKVTYIDLSISEWKVRNSGWNPGGESQCIPIVVLHPDISYIYLVQQGEFYAADMELNSQAWRGEPGQFMSKEALHRLCLHSHVQGRQYKKEDCQHDEHYFPAFFDNFAFSQSKQKSG